MKLFGILLFHFNLYSQSIQKDSIEISAFYGLQFKTDQYYLLLGGPFSTVPNETKIYSLENSSVSELINVSATSYSILNFGLSCKINKFSFQYEFGINKKHYEDQSNSYIICNGKESLNSIQVLYSIFYRKSKLIRIGFTGTYTDNRFSFYMTNLSKLNSDVRTDTELNTKNLVLGSVTSFLFQIGKNQKLAFEIRIPIGAYYFSSLDFYYNYYKKKTLPPTEFIDRKKFIKSKSNLFDNQLIPFLGFYLYYRIA